jgi:hypothetical protein
MTNKLLKFKIIFNEENRQVNRESVILLNLDHIVSVKPIKITAKDHNVIDGYWIRLSNNKKYKATEVPQIILDALNEIIPANNSLNSDFEESAIQ